MVTALSRITVASFALAILATPVAARTWTSAGGHYTFEGEAIAFGGKTLVLKRDRTERLVAVNVEELSEKDQRYIESRKDELAQPPSAVEGEQTWTSRKGWKIRGRVLAFGEKELSVQRQRGQATINGTSFTKLSPLHQRLVLATLEYLENREFEGQGDLNRWLMTLRGQAKTYPLEGVLLELESGDRLPVPLVLFSEENRKLLEPGWQAWKASEEDNSRRERESFLVQQEALQYQMQQRQQQAQYQQMEMLKLNLLGAAVGVTDIWEVGLIPRPGVYGRPTSVVVSAPNSAAASQIALRQYPGYVIGAIRKASN